MSDTSGVTPLPILAVLGPSDASKEESTVAERVGAAAAGPDAAPIAGVHQIAVPEPAIGAGIETAHPLDPVAGQLFDEPDYDHMLPSPSH